MTDPSEQAALLLVNRVVRGLRVDPLSPKEFWSVLRQAPDPDALLGLSAEEIASEAGLRPSLAERVAELLAGGAAFAVELERLNASGIELLSALHEGFPAVLRERLGDACPGAIFTAGPQDWLAEGGLGVVGSREPSEEAVAVAAEAGRLAAQRGWPLVSGVARGIDRAAMSAALEAGGRVTGAPTEGLHRLMRNAEVRAAVLSGDLCLLSPYGPEAGFTTGNAMGRNRFIYALANVTLAVAAERERGGTWAGATEALKRRYGRVATWTGAGAQPGNAALQQLGAEPVDDLEALDVTSVLATATSDEQPASRQLSLDLDTDSDAD